MQVKVFESPFAALLAALALSTGSLAYVGATSALAQDTGGVGLSEGALLEYERNTINIFEQYSPSVVAVNVTVGGEQVIPEGFEEFFEEIPEEFRRFLAPQQPQQPRPQEGSGSGFVVTEGGRILTNYHVVRSALEEDDVALREDAEITVTFPSSDDTYPVRVVGANETYDLALLELSDPDNVPQEVMEVLPIPIADSDEIRVGQKAIAIGNPFGFQTTVTEGIVSGVSRSLPGVGEVDIPLVQTDAPINPGNSGGPLLNSQGELIGINTAIIPSLGFGGQRGNLGIGFAVPANILVDNLTQLEEGGFVDVRSRARLGVGIADVQTYPENVRERLDLPEEGVVITQVEPGSAAEAAGLQGGDIEVMIDGQPVAAGGDVILAVDGAEVTSSSQLQNLIFSRGEGDTVELRILRDGEEQTVEVTLARVQQDEEDGGTGGDDD